METNDNAYYAGSCAEKRVCGRCGKLIEPYEYHVCGGTNGGSPVNTPKKSFDIEEVIKNLPAGLDRTILRVLSFHKGRNKAIGGENLLAEIRRHGFKIDRRVMRAQISQLRKHGHLIGSAPGSDGGYWLCSDAEDFNKFVDKEYLAKIADMQETLSAMKRSAVGRWGKGITARQDRLI
jgi:hypothetical protein